MRFIFCLLFLGLPAYAGDKPHAADGQAAHAAPLTAEERARIGSLIRQLGAGRFSLRERASVELAALQVSNMGELRSMLEEATKSGDAEVVTRATKVLAAIAGRCGLSSRRPAPYVAGAETEAWYECLVDTRATGAVSGATCALAAHAFREKVAEIKQKTSACGERSRFFPDEATLAASADRFCCRDGASFRIAPYMAGYYGRRMTGAESFAKLCIELCKNARVTPESCRVAPADEKLRDGWLLIDTFRLPGAPDAQVCIGRHPEA